MRLAVSIIAVAILASGCSQRQPEGQIVATVNGDDITTHDLNRVEAQLPLGTKVDKTLRDQLMSALVDRLLSVQEAKRGGLSKTPEYLDASRTANEGILVDLLSRRVIQGLQPPSPPDLDRYVAAHASDFANRQLVRLDQIRFARSDAAMASLRGVTTLEDAEAALKASGTPYQRGVATIDTLALRDDLAQQLASLPPGRLLGDQQNGLASISSVVGRTPKPLSDKETRDAATTLIQRDAARDALVGLRQRLRQSARITYQKDYAPNIARPAK